MHTGVARAASGQMGGKAFGGAVADAAVERTVFAQNQVNAPIAARLRFGLQGGKFFGQADIHRGHDEAV
ncbi:hypothetical protein NEIELOOT_00026 [Neisseria elongata subsp. glycolytica ATCC 29315]|uniref:Uncharacterized protein n=1 Tax=Neisseria elongata subsp. glycolytica ATCC 29315 TaxID=546263 RepID=D4DLW6_NEIEG|nr:hypothetical protein NEIELOOT_00026 [Neisseria elongata subsp. glycolytica ATCC 29315]